MTHFTDVTLPLDRELTASEGVISRQRQDWWAAGLALLSVRFIQGFIYWGGGSRRFIYGPSKLDAWGGHNWMANKFQTAMPGALFGTDHIISYMLTHFWLLYAGVILFSAAELIVGLMLMTGFLTRFAALASMGFSVMLMAMFGWQGATCIDEWTMAAANLAMGATLLLAGGGAYSIDNVLLRRIPALADRSWFRWAGGSLPLPQGDRNFRNLAFALFAFVVLFDVGTYNYYRGSVFTPFHGGPVSPTKHHFTIDSLSITPDGAVRFHIYLDGGTPEAPAHIMKAVLLGPDRQVIESWDTKELTGLPKDAIQNDYAYNKFEAGPYGLVAAMGAKATITLPALAKLGVIPARAILELSDVNGRSFTATAGADLVPHP
jgi:thiosulfate dehydrogenase [quinone] large subunit